MKKPKRTGRSRSSSNDDSSDSSTSVPSDPWADHNSLKEESNEARSDEMAADVLRDGR